jgi:hypothetical protein
MGPDPLSNTKMQKIDLVVQRYQVSPIIYMGGSRFNGETRHNLIDRENKKEISCYPQHWQPVMQRFEMLILGHGIVITCKAVPAGRFSW